MTGSVEQWVNKIEVRRRNREELREILAEYFTCGFNEDEEIARGTGIDLAEIVQLRLECEA
jgi:hypothetical protein